ncbi:MAG: ATP-binding cassette domain-containing protein [Clostridium perfringens]|uniref:ATP-binding cassette domain-containing protein n=1 Tax=Clostridium perfringens TaxID=1502 RepID=UPI000DF0ED6A|nr:ATP-binding cassette domain-containing protein [Clostridium perfringens]QDB01010.1 ABC transporter ATP-binding protein YtrB [Clostridium perfringens]STB42082.1 ABC transporter-like protein [Clostridium perfringens]
MIEIRRLNKSYKNNVIFNECTISFESNKINFLMGANGQGKTTLFKCLLNLDNYSGEILFDDYKFKDIIDNIFAIYDDSPLYLNLTGLQNISIFLERKVSKNEYEAFQNILSNRILERKVREYSYGQKKILSIIIAFLKAPKYLIIDEISNGLDFETMIWLKDNLKLLSKNTTIIATGHQFEFYNNIIDNLYIINDKKIVQVDKKFKDKGLSSVYEQFISKH